MVIFSYMLFPTYTAANSINEKEKEKLEIIKRQDRLKKEKSQKQKEIKMQEEQFKEIIEELSELKKEQVELEKEIELSEKDFVSLTEKIDQLNIFITQYQIDFDQRMNVAVERARAIQVSDNTKSDFLFFLINATSFSDLFHRVDVLQTLFSAERTLLKQIENDQKVLNHFKLEHEESLDKVKKIQISLEEKRQNIKSQSTKKKEIMKRLEDYKEKLSQEQQKIKNDLLIEQEKLSHVEDEMIRISTRERIKEQEIERAKQQEIQKQSEQLAISNKPSPTTSKSEESNSSCKDEININQLNKKLSSAGKMSGTGDIIVRVAKRNNIDPIIFSAIMLHETGFGSSNAIRNYNNPGGMMNPATNWSTLIKYPSLEVGYESTAKTISRLMNKGGLSTIEQLGAVYAPIGASNDPTGLNRFWAPNVNRLVNELKNVSCQTS